MEIRIFGLADDSIVDGPGVRYTVFVQGCPHHCPGCHNPASHDFAGGTLMDTDGIIRKIGENPLLDGVTLSGGEPMCQPEACCAIADAAHAKHLNVWCYTGFTLDALLKETPNDVEALAGRAQVALLARSMSFDPEAIVARASVDPNDVEAQLDAADLEIINGRSAEALDRLLSLAAESTPEDRDRIRVRLLELFEIIGRTDPVVLKARRRLATVLF